MTPATTEYSADALARVKHRYRSHRNSLLKPSIAPSLSAFFDGKERKFRGQGHPRQVHKWHILEEISVLGFHARVSGCQERA